MDYVQWHILDKHTHKKGLVEWKIREEKNEFVCVGGTRKFLMRFMRGLRKCKLF